MFANLETKTEIRFRTPEKSKLDVTRGHYLVDERHKKYFSVDGPGVFREDFLLFYCHRLTTLDQEGSSQVTKRPGKHCKERKRRHNNNPSSSGVIVANNVVKKSFHTFFRAARLFLCFHL